MGRNSKGGAGAILIAAVLIILLLRGGLGEGSFLGALFHLVGMAFKAVLLLGVIALLITGAVIYFSEKDKKLRGKRDAPNVTPKGAKPEQGGPGPADAKKAGTGASNAGKQAGPHYADRSKTYEKTPEGVRLMLTDYRSDCVLGQVAQDALAQKDRLESQFESYRRLVERRFGKGTLSAEKYLAVESSANDALQNSYLRIANRMEAFDSREYMSFTTGAYREDSIPDHVQEQRWELYNQNLTYMKDCLADNEHILAGMDRLMLKLADSDSAEPDTTEEIETLEQQLAYYNKYR